MECGAGFRVLGLLAPETCRKTKQPGGHGGKKLAHSSVSSEDNSGSGAAARKFYG